MNNKSKKIAAACLALAMVASVGAADVSGILPVVKPVTASAEGSDKLSDGEYYCEFEPLRQLRSNKYFKF